MGWELYALLRAIGSAGHSISLKSVLNNKENSLIAVPLFVVLVPGILYTIIATSLGQYETIDQNENFYLGLFGNVTCNALNYLLNVWIIRRFDISYVESMKTVLPVFAGIFGSLILQEYLSLEVWLCIIVIVIGCFLLEYSRKVLDPKADNQVSKWGRLKSLIQSSGWFFMIPWLCLNALATVFSKMVVVNGNIELYLGWRYLILSFFFLSVGYIYFKFKQKTVMGFIRSFFTKNNAKATYSGIFLALIVAAEMRALQLADIALVETLSKGSLFLILFAEIIFLKKALNWLRILSGSIILLGVMIFFYLT